MRCLWNGDHPCGKCPACLANRQRGFMFRLDKEKEFCSFYYWLTLQYDPDHVPRKPSGDMCFDKKHCRLFFEHIRIKYRESGITFKHFLVSEYGGNGTKRPHYHCLLLVYCPVHLNLADQFKLNREMRDYLIHQAWKYGHVTEKAFHGRVLRYLTKYCCKPEIVGDYHEMSPFTMISSGIGEKYLESLSKDRINQIKSSGDFTVRYGSGKIQLPRYYLDKILPSSRADREKALEENNLERFKELNQNWYIRRSSNRRLASLQASKLEQQFKINDDLIGFDTSKYLRLSESNRDYAYEEFKTKIRQRKDL